MANNHPELVRGVPTGLERGLRNYWYPIVQTEEVPADRPVGTRCLGEELVVWRDGAGRARVFNDRCPHRRVRLSIGRIVGGELQCPFHGIRFGGDGACTLIPWEPEDSDLREKIPAAAYPSAEIGGYVWAYIGDAARFPPPPFEEALPEELLAPDRFVHFRAPTEIWNANWLLVLDGSDTYHAVALHVDSQNHDAVLRYLDPAVVAGLGAAGTGRAPPPVPLEDRRIRIIEHPGRGLRGISVDREGRQLDHGHTLHEVKGQWLNLPCLVTTPISAVRGAAPYVSRLFQVPIDETRTRIFRYAAWRAETDAERARLKDHYEKVVRVRQLKTSAEDKLIADSNAGLVEARSDEFLFSADRDVVRVRRRLADAYLAQLDGKHRADDEPTPSREALRFPV